MSMNGYIALQIKVQNELTKDLKLAKIELDEFIAVLYLLGQSNNEAELRSSLAMYCDDFTTLAKILEDELVEAKEKSEVDIQLAISQLIRDDAKLALAVMEFLKLKPTTDEVMEKFPALKNYIV